MTIATSKGKTYSVEYAWAPTSDGKLMIMMADSRPIAEIAAEFDGVTRFERESDTEGNAVYEGYEELVSIRRKERDGMVQMTIAKKQSVMPERRG